ncbi:MAG: hypothetical protein LBG60_08185, partial [Bifidobacteriaceae bacterium]|nr:hypothetical protein [Bifidobacteriaceae bacterium]
MKGDPFAKCEVWASRIEGIPDGLAAKCENTEGNHLNARRLLGVGEIGIYLKKAEEKPPDSRLTLPQL